MKPTKLERFVNDRELHERALSHIDRKGLDMCVLSTFSQDAAWSFAGDLIANCKIEFKPPVEMYIDKLTGNWLTFAEAEKRNFEEVRKLAVLETFDRVLCNTFYKMYYDDFHHLIHPNCVSYRRGLSAGKTVKALVSEMNRRKWYKGYKLDLSKFFDTVNRETLDRTLDIITPDKDCIDNIVIKHYHDDTIIVNGKPEYRYKSLSQGNPIACLLADLCLRDIDETISNMDVIYYRYSDDIIILGREADHALEVIKQMLEPKGVTLNPKKVKALQADKEWFEFLGFKIRGDLITVSAKTLRGIEQHIKSETIQWSREHKRPATEAETRRICRRLQKYLFLAYEENSNQFGMCQYLFGTVNCKHDIDMIDRYCKDCLRAVITGRNKVWGLGSTDNNPNYTIQFQKGINVKANRERTVADGIDMVRAAGWYSLNHMYKVYHTDHELWLSEINKIKGGVIHDAV